VLQHGDLFNTNLLFFYMPGHKSIPLPVEPLKNIYEVQDSDIRVWQRGWSVIVN
jgi:hypothetical protein